MYKRRSKPVSTLSSQNRTTLSNSVVATTSSIASTSLTPVAITSPNENINPNGSQAKRMKPSQLLDNNDENMFEIPCSQDPAPSRFSSQRSILARTQSILSIQRQPKNYFESVLIKCGVGMESMECYVLTCNHLNFVSKVRDLLRSSDNYPDNIKDFVSGITDAMKTYINLAKLFSGCKLSLPSSDSIYQSQESLIKDLLMIDFLQVDLIEVLFEKIETFVGRDETLSLDIPYVDLMLSELKYLNIVEHGDIVSLKVFQVFELATTNYQQVIIRSIPDIIDVGHHDEAMEKLMRTVPDDTNLLAFSNVDTFGNMHLSAAVLSTLRTKIVNHMKYRATHECFPSFVKFILRINKDEIDTLPQQRIKTIKNLFGV